MVVFEEPEQLVGKLLRRGELRKTPKLVGKLGRHPKSLRFVFKRR
jgi:hypothetical protein